MAVVCPATGDEVTIRFDYHTPGLMVGILITIVAILLLVLYYFLMRIWDRRMHRKLDCEIPLSPLKEEESTDTWESEWSQNTSVAQEDDTGGFDLYQYYGGGSRPCRRSPPGSLVQKRL